MSRERVKCRFHVFHIWQNNPQTRTLNAQPDIVSVSCQASAPLMETLNAFVYWAKRKQQVKIAQQV